MPRCSSFKYSTTTKKERQKKSSEIMNVPELTKKKNKKAKKSLTGAKSYIFIENLV